LNIKHDISLSVSAIPDFVAHTDALLAQEIAGVRLVNFGHLGDGNLHYNVQCPVGGDAARFFGKPRAPHQFTLVYEAVMRLAAPSALSTVWVASKPTRCTLQRPRGASTDAQHQAGDRPAELDESGKGVGQCSN
jgi:FAD/FMN-containing dehydrogenase